MAERPALGATGVGNTPQPFALRGWSKGGLGLVGLRNGDPPSFRDSAGPRAPWGPRTRIPRAPALTPTPPRAAAGGAGVGALAQMPPVMGGGLDRSGEGFTSKGERTLAPEGPGEMTDAERETREVRARGGGGTWFCGYTTIQPGHGRSPARVWGAGKEERQRES